MFRVANFGIELSAMIADRDELCEKLFCEEDQRANEKSSQDILHHGLPGLYSRRILIFENAAFFSCVPRILTVLVNLCLASLCWIACHYLDFVN